jgi:hypothetical protein
MLACWRCCDNERAALDNSIIILEHVVIVVIVIVIIVVVPTFRKCSFNPMNSIQQTLQGQQGGQTPVDILAPLGF